MEDDYFGKIVECERGFGMSMFHIKNLLKNGGCEK